MHIINKDKTILFFDRCDLTALYILIGKELEEKCNIVHVAYSDTEAKELKEAGISEYYHYSNLFSKKIDSFVSDDTLLKAIDEDIIKYSNGSFNLNGSIQSDRGFTLFNYDQCLVSAQCHYLVWKDIFSAHNVDVFYHEPCSLFLNHIAAILCNKQGGIFRYLVQVKSDREGFSYLNVRGDKFTCPEMEKRYGYYVEHPEEISIDRCKKYLKNFREDYSVFFGNVVNNTISDFSLLKNGIIRALSNFKHRNEFDLIKNNIDYWLVHQNKYFDKLKNKYDYCKRNIKFVETIPVGEKYYYYSMHLEPEAVVLYLGDGIYVNQIKLIENIAASLPVGCYLYVKDHPHEYAYRNANDYERLMKVPNVRLIHQAISGKALIANSIGVFTINGTAGFEGLMLNKQVYCLGKNYYSFFPKVNYVKNVRDIRNVIYKNVGEVFEDDLTLLAYVNAFLDSSHEGFVNYFGNRANKFCKDQVRNAKNIASDLTDELFGE